jgi:hypothetical protein
MGALKSLTVVSFKSPPLTFLSFILFFPFHSAFAHQLCSIAYFIFFRVKHMAFFFSFNVPFTESIFIVTPLRIFSSFSSFFFSVSSFPPPSSVFISSSLTSLPLSLPFFLLCTIIHYRIFHRSHYPAFPFFLPFQLCVFASNLRSISFFSLCAQQKKIDRVVL